MFCAVKRPSLGLVRRPAAVSWGGSRVLWLPSLEWCGSASGAYRLSSAPSATNGPATSGVVVSRTHGGGVFGGTVFGCTVFGRTVLLAVDLDCPTLCQLRVGVAITHSQRRCHVGLSRHLEDAAPKVSDLKQHNGRQRGDYDHPDALTICDIT
jgi:hypothetical protein